MTATTKGQVARIKKLIKGAERTINRNTREIKKLEKLYAKLTKRKMRPGGGKAKGGKYEHTIANMIATEFADLGIKPNDVYRTKNSGAGPKQKGDLQLSAAAERLLPFTIECKHAKKFDMFHLLVPYKQMQKSWLFKQWWKQLREECKVSKKPGLLIWRANNCPDLVAVRTIKLYPYIDQGKATVPHILVQSTWSITVMLLEDFLQIMKEHHKRYGKVRRFKRNKY